MANVHLHIGGRSYEVSCADGDEDNLTALAEIVNQKAQQARHVAGDVNEARQLLFAALFLADELQLAKASQPGTGPDLAQHIDRFTARITGLAEAIERDIA